MNYDPRIRDHRPKAQTPAWNGDVSVFHNPQPMPVKFQAPTPDDPTPAREKIAIANRAIETAKDLGVKARAFHAKAAKAEAEARQVFREAQSTDHKILTFKLDALQNDTSDDLPKELQDARTAGLHAAQELGHAQAILSTAAGQLAAAESAIASAQSDKRRAIDLVVIDEARALADRVLEMDAERKRLFEFVRAATTTELPHTEIYGQALQRIEPRYEPTMAYPALDKGSVDAWSALRQALAVDPEAKFGGFASA